MKLCSIGILYALVTCMAGDSWSEFPAGVVLASVGAKSVVTDACASRIPDALQAQLRSKFIGYQLPVAADNLAEDIAYNRAHGGDGCLGVASADFNGDRREDYAVLLHGEKAGHTLLIVATGQPHEWRTSRLRTWTGRRSRLYVAVAAPGTYRRAESLDKPPAERGEVSLVRSVLPGIVTGHTESSGVYYFWRRNKWLHVWVVD